MHDLRYMADMFANLVEGIHISSSGTLSFDRPKGSPVARQMPDPYGLSFLAPLQTHLGIVPPAGRFWHAVTASNTLLCTWQDVYFSRLSEYPVSFQVELWPHGDFTYRYNFSALPDQKLFTDYWPLATNFVIGAQHNHGGETFTFGDTNAVVHGLELRWRAFGVLDPGIADHDGDGLSTYDEVMLYGTDPRRVDTDGDGLGDYEEIFVYGTDPLEPQNYNIDEPDANNDGVIDHWEGSGLYYGFVDDNGDGFDDRLETQLPVASSNNVDILVTVTTSRSTALAWGGDALVLTAGTWRVRLRLPIDEDTAVALEQPAVAAGPWRADLSWQWHPERHDEAGLRIMGGPALFLQGQDGSAPVATILDPPPGLRPAAAVPAAEWLTPYAQLHFFTGNLWIENPATFYCSRHQRGSVVLRALTTGPVSKPLHWYYGNAQAGAPPAGMGDTFAAERSGLIYCFENGGHPGVASKHLLAIGWVHIYDCGPPQTNILAAADLPDHTPTTRQAPETIHYCTKTNLNVYVGFDHSRVNTSNLVLIAAHTEEAYQRTQHCLGVVWAENGSLGLFSLLHENYEPYANDFRFSSSNASLSVNSEGVLSFGQKDPKDMVPLISLITLHYEPNQNVNAVLDRLWLVVNRSDAQALFDAWYVANSNMNWTTNLPRPFKSIPLATNATSGVITPIDPEPGVPDKWATPHVANTYLHHDAAYEMRSHPVTGGHGHQAMYCAGGKLMEEPIAAGSADFYAPYKKDGKPKKSRNHRDEDVYPFIRALQLDGNPVQKIGKIVWIDAPQNLDRPAIFKGANVNKYVERRPVLP